MTPRDMRRPEPAEPAVGRVADFPSAGPDQPAGTSEGDTAGGLAARDPRQPTTDGAGGPAPRPAPEAAATGKRGLAARLARHGVALAAFLAAGVALTWPRAAYLTGRLPDTRDAAGYVWGFWWVAHQVTHLGDPWQTTYQAAPVGTELGFHTLMPLPGLLMTPVTLAFGPSASYNLLSAACPGLLAYTMYRAARLWLPGRLGAVAAGCLFGFSPELCWYSWYEVNLAVGAVFFPLTLAAAVRLRRGPGPRRAVALGAVVAASVLTDQESAAMTAALAVLALLPWLVRGQGCWRRRLRFAALAAAAAGTAASPQILAMAAQAASGNAGTPPEVIAHFYNPSGVGLVQMFAPSPRLVSFGLTPLASLYYQGRPLQALAGYGAVVSALGAAGLAAAWRRRSARRLALLWLGSSVMALGSAPWLLDRAYKPFPVRFHGVPMSAIMPYTWLVRLPGLAGFREADRFTGLGLVGAALLAGAAVGWLRAHARPLLVAVLAGAVLEVGWTGSLRVPGTPRGVMPTALPAVVRPIAADHSRSIVVAVPFGVRGGLPVLGGAYPPETMVLATCVGHPVGDAFVSRIPSATLRGIRRRPFYAGLLRAQDGWRPNTPSMLVAARDSARRMGVGWVLDWLDNAAVSKYLRQTGFRFAYRADGVRVYRRVQQAATPNVARPVVFRWPRLWSKRGDRPSGPLPRRGTGQRRSAGRPA